MVVWEAVTRYLTEAVGRGEQVGAGEYRARYLGPAGRDISVSAIERFVYGRNETS
jgi:hypothetical protein